MLMHEWKQHERHDTDTECSEDHYSAIVVVRTRCLPLYSANDISGGKAEKLVATRMSACSLKARYKLKGKKKGKKPNSKLDTKL
jgi:hypothetical protein